MKHLPHPSPLRSAVLTMVDLAADGSFSDEDVHHLAQLVNGEISLTRVRAYLTILVAHRALIALPRGWCGRRFRRGRRWERWRAEEVTSYPGGESTAYKENRVLLERLSEAWSHHEDHIRERLREERVKHDLGMGTLASKVGLRKDHLYKIETGRKPLNLAVLVKIAIGMGVSLDYLVDVAGFARELKGQLA
jgi:DNA-binding XRE family transcriptional regulator